MATGPDADGFTPDDFEISRSLAAPRRLVFAMWTSADHFVRWFGPRSARIDACKIDPRPGGVIAFHHHHGRHVLHVRGVFDEVKAPERLVFTTGFVDAAGKPCAPPMLPGLPPEARVLTTVVLQETAGTTLMKVRQRVVPPELAQRAAVKTERRDARAGWEEMFDRLTEELTEELKGEPPWQG